MLMTKVCMNVLKHCLLYYVLSVTQNMPIPVFPYSWNIHMNYIRTDACLVEILKPNIQYEEIDLN
jgi:hypothetical protein